MIQQKVFLMGLSFEIKGLLNLYILTGLKNFLGVTFQKYRKGILLKILEMINSNRSPCLVRRMIKKFPLYCRNKEQTKKKKKNLLC